MFTDRVETTVKIEDRLRNMSDEERLAYSTELLERARSIAGPPGPDEPVAIDVEAEPLEDKRR
jgi:hypothetical protein